MFLSKADLRLAQAFPYFGKQNQRFLITPGRSLDVLLPALATVDSTLREGSARQRPPGPTHL